jgi:hypothetical protein
MDVPLRWNSPRGGPLNAGRDVRVVVSIDNQQRARSFQEATKAGRANVPTTFDLIVILRGDVGRSLCRCLRQNATAQAASAGLESSGSPLIFDQMMRATAFGRVAPQLSRAAQDSHFAVRNL